MVVQDGEQAVVLMVWFRKYRCYDFYGYIHFTQGITYVMTNMFEHRVRYSERRRRHAVRRHPQSIDQTLASPSSRSHIYTSGAEQDQAHVSHSFTKPFRHFTTHGAVPTQAKPENHDPPMVFSSPKFRALMRLACLFPLVPSGCSRSSACVLPCGSRSRDRRPSPSTTRRFPQQARNGRVWKLKVSTFGLRARLCSRRGIAFLRPQDSHH